MFFDAEHAFAACMSPVLLPSLAPCSLLLGSGFAMKCRLKQPVLRYANGRIKPVSKTQAKQDGINSEFHKQGLSYSGGRKPSCTNKLRALRQVSFPELCSWSPKKCEANTWRLSCFHMRVCKGFGSIVFAFRHRCPSGLAGTTEVLWHASKATLLELPHTSPQDRHSARNPKP